MNWIRITTLVLLPALAGSAPHAQEGEDEVGRGELFQRSMEQLFDSAESVPDQAGSDTPVAFSGDDEPRWLQGLTVARSDNPLLEQACREQALEANTRRLQDQGTYASDAETLQATMEHMHMHHEFIRGQQVSYGRYLASLSECREFCAPLVASLMQCHVLSVARKPHGIVLFELASSRVEPPFRTGVIDEMASSWKEAPDSRILLVGRASPIGNLEYNRRLAAQRALAVRDELTGLGVPFERIRPMWFGWEPPQIDREIAGEYGFGTLYEENGHDTLNQSVVMVIFEE